MAVGWIIFESNKKIETIHWMPLGVMIKAWMDIKTCSYWSMNLQICENLQYGHRGTHVCFSIHVFTLSYLKNLKFLCLVMNVVEFKTFSCTQIFWNGTTKIKSKLQLGSGRSDRFQVNDVLGLSSGEFMLYLPYSLECCVRLLCLKSTLGFLIVLGLCFPWLLHPVSSLSWRTDVRIVKHI